VTVHRCPICGKHLDEGVRFCPDDGTPLTDTAAAAGRTPTGQPARKIELVLPVVVGGRYRLEEARGGGGMAKVYRAVDLTLEREVAVKLINPELRAEPEFDARFQREARIASQLADPHIVVVHDFGLDAVHGPYLVMEFLRGQSLRERLRAEGPLPYKAGLQLSAQLLLALIHAHDKGIVHRDIKPDNVFLLNQSGIRLVVRVLDFGIARIYKQDQPGQGEALTDPGAVLGTPRYMSPEQLAGQPVEARSDLYSAALVVHEALTGQLPYVSGRRLCELCPDATPAFQELLDHCLRQNPAERPENALEVYLRLQELGKASGILLLPPGAMDKLVAARKAQQGGQEPTLAYVPERGAWLTRRRLLLGGVAAAVLAAGGAAAYLLSGRGNPAPSAAESLLGLYVGDGHERVQSTLGEPQEKKAGNPWAGDDKRAADSLGHVLRESDLDGGGPVQVWWWDNRHVCVVLQDGAVRAVVVHEPHKGESGRGVKIGYGDAHMKRAYDDLPQTKAFHVPVKGTFGEAYRYDGQGIGFEVVGEKVRSITLFPKKAP
jgi:hypothetical protein